MLTFNVASSINVSIFSFPINIVKSLFHNIESVLSSSIFLSHKPAIFNPFDLGEMLGNISDCVEKIFPYFTALAVLA